MERKRKSQPPEIPYRVRQRVAQHNGRAIRGDCEGSFTAEEWLDLLESFNGKCANCGSDKNVQIDHKIPMHIGGSNYIENIQPLCQTCNIKKSWRAGGRKMPETDGVLFTLSPEDNRVLNDYCVNNSVSRSAIAKKALLVFLGKPGA